MFFIKINKYSLLLTLFLSLGLIGDISIALNPNLIGINQLLRGLGIFPIFLLTILSLRNIRIYNLLLTGVVFFVISFVLYSVLFSNERFNIASFLSTLIWGVKNFGFIILMLFYHDSKRKGFSSEGIESILVTFFIIYLFFQVIGALLSIEVFKTYGEDGFRSGYKGIVYAVNEATVFYFFGNFFLINFYRNSRWFVKYISFFVSLFSMLILGTKAGWGLLFILLIYFSLLNYGRKKSVKYAIVFLSILLIVFVQTYSYNIVFQEAVDLSLQYYRYRLEGDYNLFSILTSGRDILFIDSFVWAKENIPTSFLFGGMPVSHKFIEMDIFDQILAFGLVYVGVYYFIIYRTLKGHLAFLAFASFLAVSILAGHAVDSIVAAPFLAGSIVFCSSSSKKL